VKVIKYCYFGLAMLSALFLLASFLPMPLF